LENGQNSAGTQFFAEFKAARRKGRFSDLATFGKGMAISSQAVCW